jgi:hypothetical protein
MTGKLTPYADVNAIVGVLLERSRAALGDDFLALYLHGSLATGAFDRARSDIDFISVLDRAPSDAAIEALRQMHREILQLGSPLVRRLEGSFVHKALLTCAAPPEAPRPYMNGARFLLADYGYEWVLEKHTIREKGLVVAGPPPARYIAPVTPAEMRSANREILTRDWAPMLTDPSRLQDPEYQAYAVLTMCRCLYLHAEHDIAAKPAAIRWVQAQLPQWHDLVEAAAHWAHGDPFDRLDEVKSLIRFTLARAVD